MEQRTMIYSVYVRYYNEYVEPEDKNENGMVEVNCFVAGETINDVITQMTDYYGEKEIDKITCEVIGPDNFIEFRGKDRKVFTMIENDIKENVVW